MVLYLAPIVFFYTGAFPIRATDSEFLVRFVPYLILSLVMFELLARGTGFLWISARYSMTKFFTYVIALSGFFATGKLKFNVTPKGPGHVPFKTYAPQIVLMVLSVGALLWAFGARELGLISYEVPGWDSLAFWLNFVWLTLNFALAAIVVRHALFMQQQRNDHRFADSLPITVQFQETEGRLHRREIALTDNLNSQGLAFRSSQSWEPGSRVRITLPLSTGEIAVKGEILHFKEVQEAAVPLYLHGVSFVDLPLETRDRIEIHCINHAVPIWQLQYRSIVTVFDRAIQFLRRARSENRQRVRIPVYFSFPDEEKARSRRAAIHEIAILDDISENGARLLMERPVAPNTLIEFGLPRSRQRAVGQVVFSTGMESPVGTRFAVGLRRFGDQPGWSFSQFDPSSAVRPPPLDVQTA